MIYRIMIVEDDEVISGATAKHIEKWGFDILQLGVPYILENCHKLRRLNTEINWYPFFWNGFHGYKELFDREIDTKTKSFLYRAVHFYWLRGK